MDSLFSNTHSHYYMPMHTIPLHQEAQGHTTIEMEQPSVPNTFLTSSSTTIDCQSPHSPVTPTQLIR